MTNLFRKDTQERDLHQSESEDMSAPSPARLVSFSDGVIAVVLTIMVLNLRLPAHDGLEGLSEMMPVIAIYLLSFAFTGIYWLNHQHVIRRLEAAGYYLQVANLAFLFCLSLLPFSTYYLIAKRLSPYSVQQYDATLLLISASFYLVRSAVHHHLKLRHQLTDRDGRTRMRHTISIVIYLICLPLAVWYPRLTVVMLGLDTAIWALPGLSRHLLRFQR